MEQLIVRSESNSYPIYIGKGIRHQLKSLLTHQNFSQLIIVTDEHVAKLYLSDVLKTLEDHVVVKSFIVKPGEQSKSISTFKEIQSFLLEEQVDRKSAIIALGGGVIGDLAGFVASTYMRGITFIQMPTTLLAHDSSVGGKVAINLDQTKNIIGHFYAPDLVVFDTETLTSLPEREIRSGFAEMVKHGYLSKDGLLDNIRHHIKQSIDPTKRYFDQILLESIKVKRDLVEQDEREINVRKYLNFGHTLGHAIEAITDYTHGECVMYGILFNLYVSERVQGLHQQFLTTDMLNWIKELKYPLHLISEQDIDQLIDKMYRDKKTVHHRIHFVLIRIIGDPFIRELSAKEIKQYLLEFMEMMD